MKYVYRNPVRAGLSERVETYPYSTLACLVGEGALRFSVVHPFRSDFLNGLPEGLLEQVEWFNQPFLKELEEGIARAFRRTQFSLKERKGWKRSLTESPLIGLSVCDSGA